MTPIAMACFILLAVLVATLTRRGTDILSPGRLFALIWTAAIGLAELKLSRLQHHWSDFAWFALLSPIMSFLAGIAIVTVISLNHKRLSTTEIRATIAANLPDEKYLFRAIMLLFAAYSAAYAIEWVRFGTLPLLSPKPDVARSQFSMFGVHLFVNSMPVVLFLCAQYILLIKGSQLKKLLLGLVFVISFVSYFFLLNRLPYVMFIVLFIGLAYYGTNFFRARWLIPAFVATVAILRSLQSFREVRYARNYFYVISEMRYGEHFAEFTAPYMYVVMNLENYARAVVKELHTSFGFFSFDFVMALVGLKHPLAAYFGLRREQFLISGYNTYPFFWDYYLDFGIVGLLVLPFLFGFAVALLYQRLREKPTLLTITAYSCVLYALVFSFFANMLALLNTAFPFALLLLIQYVVSKKQTSNAITAQVAS